MPDTKILRVFIHTLLRLLRATLLRGRGVQPQRNKRQPARNRNPDARNPGPGAADAPRARPLVVGEVAHRHLALLVEGGEEGALVVDAEVEDAVLVGQAEVGGEDGRVGVRGRRRERRQREAVEGRQHREFELQLVAGRGQEGLEVVLGVLGDLDLEGLGLFC